MAKTTFARCLIPSQESRNLTANTDMTGLYLDLQDYIMSPEEEATIIAIEMLMGEEYDYYDSAMNNGQGAMDARG